MITLRLTYYPDITQGVPDHDVREAIIAFSNALAERLAGDVDKEIKIDVAPVMTVPEQYNDLLQGTTHIALMKPVAYVFAHMKNSQIVPACVAHRPIDGAVGTYYFSQIYSRSDLGFKTLRDVLDHGPGKLTLALSLIHI